MSEIAKLKQMLAEIKERLDSFEQGVSGDFDKVTVEGVDYYDSKKDCTHQEAHDLAAKHGLRVMESWEMHKLWIESEEFRNSLEPKLYWCASVTSKPRDLAWRFYGDNGFVSISTRGSVIGVRCVSKE